MTAKVDIPAGSLLFKESPLFVYDDRRGPGEAEREDVYRFALSHLKDEVQATVLELSNVFAGPDVLVGTLRTNAYPLVQFAGDDVSCVLLWFFPTRCSELKEDTRTDITPFSSCSRA